MIANVNVGGVVITISVDKGEQTFKWLAQVLTSRIKIEKLLRSKFGPDDIIVTGIFNVSKELINPLDKLFEHKLDLDADSNDLIFTAQILPQFEIDEYGNPIYDDWLHTAYLVTENSQKWSSNMQYWRDKEQTILKDKIRMKEENSDDEDDNNDQGTAWNDTLNAGSSLIHIGADQLSSHDVEIAFTLDWDNMKFTWLNNFSIHKKIALHDMLKKNYDIICNLFLHYCGVGKIGQRYGMTVLEFNHMLTFATKGKRQNTYAYMYKYMYI